MVFPAFLIFPNPSLVIVPNTVPFSSIVVALGIAIVPSIVVVAGSVIVPSIVVAPGSVIVPCIVIPAQAGIPFAVGAVCAWTGEVGEIKLDSSLRWNDGIEGIEGTEGTEGTEGVCDADFAIPSLVITPLVILAPVILASIILEPVVPAFDPVIPAQAGIHFAVGAVCAWTGEVGEIKLDSSLRWNDGIEGIDGTEGVCDADFVIPQFVIPSLVILAPAILASIILEPVVPAFDSVIPAQAGIPFAVGAACALAGEVGEIKLDSSLRWNDGDDGSEDRDDGAESRNGDSAER